MSKLVNFCSDARHARAFSSGRAADLGRTRRALVALLETAVGMARRLCGADRASLLLVVEGQAGGQAGGGEGAQGGGSSGGGNEGRDGGGGEVSSSEPHLWSMVSEGLPPLRLALGTGLAGHVALSGDSLNVPDAYEDAR